MQNQDENNAGEQTKERIRFLESENRRYKVDLMNAKDEIQEAENSLLSLRAEHADELDSMEVSPSTTIGPFVTFMRSFWFAG
jgi:hypothetical protein